MATRSFELSCVIAASPSSVAAHLREPQNHRGLQPLITEIIEHERSHPQDGHGRAHARFDAIERVPILGLRYPNRIAIRCEADTKADEHGTLAVRFEARSKPMLRLTSQFTLLPRPGPREGYPHCRLVERVEITLPWLLDRLLGRFSFDTARAAHERLLSNLRARLEPQ
ncbi:hypothetical protein PPSIR1_16630 [Plesiocystis pacifica SIR-1]|uniref:SRPBCC family protein n=1 Tax=Plesiocystis pacifica SIR-1 TaxID=391625 RepID=A6G381_9BACT|nr:SRPBCC family protein [Plesiocystis pacifica]EDM79706.1 hypothetical protein PPSIR1_16630 [Plesiocystis pacifica SIR-1]